MSFCLGNKFFPPDYKSKTMLRKKNITTRNTCQKCYRLVSGYLGEGMGYGVGGAKIREMSPALFELLLAQVSGTGLLSLCNL